MDPEEFRVILSRSRAGIWELIEAAIKVAGSDYADELRRRRDTIVELLYAPAPLVCRNCSGDIRRDAVEHEPYFPEIVCNGYNSSEHLDNTSKYEEEEDDDENKKFNRNSNPSAEFTKSSPLIPEPNNLNFSGGEEEEAVDPYGAFLDDELTKILTIKEQLEDLNQSEDTVVGYLQTLANMDITFHTLEETDIGRHVNRLRKHSSNEVRELVRQLVRKWKETVDEWAKVNKPQATSNLIADGDSPQQSILKSQQNGYHQVPDFGYLPNTQNGSSSVKRKSAEHESKHKLQQSAVRREALSRPSQSVPKSTSALPSNRAPQRESTMDDAKLMSARKRLQENYQEAQNAKKQRTIQVMDIHEIPKPKKSFFAKNKGNFQGRHHR